MYVLFSIYYPTNIVDFHLNSQNLFRKVYYLRKTTYLLYNYLMIWFHRLSRGGYFVKPPGQIYQKVNCLNYINPRDINFTANHPVAKAIDLKNN